MAAFQALSAICFADELHDRDGCARKAAAVDAGALELIHAGMHGLSKPLHDAGGVTIGVLCQGVDAGAHARRQRAKALFMKQTKKEQLSTRQSTRATTRVGR
jgi:hypothetical protein